MSIEKQAFVNLAISEIGSVQWSPSRRLYVEVSLTEGQIFEAIDTLLDVGGAEKRAARLEQLRENERTGAHA